MADKHFRLAVLVAALVFAAFPALAAELTVVVTDLRNADGDVHIALYDDPARFPDSDGMIDEVRPTITDSGATATFTGLTPGRYAVAVYHDENADHDFDQGPFGIPLENYAFSNGATAFFAPPSFDEAAITVSAQANRHTISMGN